MISPDQKCRSIFERGLRMSCNFTPPTRGQPDVAFPPKIHAAVYDIQSCFDSFLNKSQQFWNQPPPEGVMPTIATLGDVLNCSKAFLEEANKDFTKISIHNHACILADFSGSITPTISKRSVPRINPKPSWLAHSWVLGARISAFASL